MQDVKDVFECKNFKVKQSASLMKVNTDGMLLGAWADVTNCKRILDIGTGTGIIALMLAQKMAEDARVTAIEIDEKSAKEAKENFESAPWSTRMNVVHTSIQEFSDKGEKFDLIVSNPPFFSGGTLSINENKSNVKHTTKLPHGDLLLSLKKLLAHDGQVALILPYLEGERFIELAKRAGFYTNKVTEVHSKAHLPIERLLIGMSKLRSEERRDKLVVLEDAKERKYTSEYISLVKEYYTVF